MKGKHHRSVASAILVTLLLALLILAFSAPAGAAKKSRPFKGYLVGTVTFSEPNPDPAGPPWLWATSDAVGTVSHMGKTLLWSKHRAAMDFGSDDMTFTAANGDMITCSYHGGGQLPPNIGDWYDLWIDVTVTGGTGRFAHATGHMDMPARLQFLPMDTVWPVIFTFTGWIKY